MTSSQPQTDVLAPADAVTGGRIVSLDVFRGLTVMGMILVTNPGTYSAVYRPLLHADWNGWTPTDMIFPSFLFATGVAITLSFASRMGRGDRPEALGVHILRRSGILFALGLFLNAFPQFDLHHLRIPGVLQRIALCYLCGGLLYLYLVRRKEQSDKAPERARTRFSWLAGVTLAILIVYWALLKLVPVPGFGAGRLDSLGNLGAYIDRTLLGTRHMWPWGLTPSYGVTYDPEGLLSTLPAIATLLIGILAGEWMQSRHSGARKALGLVGAGFVLLLLGWLLNPLLPINKKLWTSTFVLFSSGFSLVTFSLCYWLVDLRRRRWWTFPALVFGTNAILSFALTSVLTALTDLIHVGGGTDKAPTFHEWGYSDVFSRAFSPYHASLAYAMTIVLLNLAIVWLLYRKRIFLRV
jgi:predicted acyltransferase